MRGVRGRRPLNTAKRTRGSGSQVRQQEDVGAGGGGIFGGGEGG
jgi:hypothetical protein